MRAKCEVLSCNVPAVNSRISTQQPICLTWIIAAADGPVKKKQKKDVLGFKVQSPGHTGMYYQFGGAGHLSQS